MTDEPKMVTMLIVEIKQCSGPRYWYRGKVGETFIAKPVRGHFMVMSRSKDDFLGRLIEEDDCVPIGEVLMPKEMAN